MEPKTSRFTVQTTVSTFVAFDPRTLIVLETNTIACLRLSRVGFSLFVVRLFSSLFRVDFVSVLSPYTIILFAVMGYESHANNLRAKHAPPPALLSSFSPVL